MRMEEFLEYIQSSPMDPETLQRQMGESMLNIRRSVAKVYGISYKYINTFGMIYDHRRI